MVSRVARAARRVLVAVDASPFGLAGIETAARLAAAWRAELLGMFVEDDRLVRLAGLPFAREIAVSTAVSRRLERPDLECLLRAKADGVRQTLTALARRLQVTCSFQVARGDLLQLSLAAATGTDVLVLAKDCPASRPSPSAKTLRPRFRTATVAVVCDGTKAAKRALAAALELAAAYHDELAVFVTAAETREGKRLARNLHRQCAAAEVPAHVVALADSGAAEQLRQWARQHLTRLLLIGRPSPVFGDADIQLLADELDCPVVLLPD